MSVFALFNALNAHRDWRPGRPGPVLAAAAAARGYMAHGHGHGHGNAENDVKSDMALYVNELNLCIATVTQKSLRSDILRIMMIRLGHWHAAIFALQCVKLEPSLAARLS